jgi:hypothetical protein
MISRAMSKAVKQAGKQQQANTRGLSGNRNSQGDFMPEIDNPKVWHEFDQKGPTLVEMGSIEGMSKDDLSALLSTLKEEQSNLIKEMDSPEDFGGFEHSGGFEQLSKVEQAIEDVQKALDVEGVAPTSDAEGTRFDGYYFKRSPDAIDKEAEALR